MRAFVGGTGVAVAMALAILALSASSYAAPVGDAPQPRSVVPTPSPGADSPGVGALWARDDTDGGMPLLLGLLGLGATAIVAMVGRRA